MAVFLKFNELRTDLEKIVRQAKDINRKMQGVDIQKVEVANASAVFQVEQDLHKLKGELNQITQVIESYTKLTVSDLGKTVADKNSAYGYLGAFKGLCKQALDELNQIRKNADLLLSMHQTFNNPSAKKLTITSEGIQNVQEIGEKLSTPIATVGVPQHPSVSGYTNQPSVNGAVSGLAALIMIFVAFRQRHPKQ
jgi:hypothetical protein